MKIKTDITVVGAGPGGATAARLLADAGLEVLLVERKNEIGKDIRCAEGIDLPTVDQVVGKIPENLISWPIDRIFIDYADQRISLNAPGHGVILERYLFDKYLAQLAAKAGAEIMLECEINEVNLKDHKWFLSGNYQHQKISIESKAVIAADGVDSLIGKMAGINTSLNPRDVYSCAEIKGDISGREEEGALLISLDEKLFTGGYAWSFPKAGGLANIGLGIRGDAGGKCAKDRLEIWLNEKFKGVPRLSYLVGAVPAKKMEAISTEGMMLIGDAARLADPISGGGIGPALTSAQLAAEVMIKLWHKNELDKTYKYDDAWWNGEGKQLEQRLFLRNIYIANDKKLLKPVFEWGMKNLDGKHIDEFSADEMLLGLIKAVPVLFKMASSIVPTLMKMVFK